MSRADTEGRTPTNRERAMRGKLGYHWCVGCDSQQVGKVGKCPVCGHRANRRKRKGI